MAIFRLKSDPVSGAVAIYSVPSRSSTDNSPLNDPFADPSRLQFHSGAVFPSTTEALTQTINVTIPAQAQQTKYSGQINLFMHGLGEACMVEGRLLNALGAGQHVGFNGSMPVNVSNKGHATWLALGATTTHVVLVYFGITAGALGAFNLTIEASAFNYFASGGPPVANPSLPLIRHVLNSFLQLGRGMVDTRRRYIRRVASGGDAVLAIGPTLSIIGSGGGAVVQDQVGWRWRYACAGYVRQTLTGWNGTSTNGGNYEAPFIRVKR